MTALIQSLLQLSAAGLLCSILLNLCGRGAQREVLRFGCSCLMVILLLSQLRQLPPLPLSQHTYGDRIRQDVEQTQREVRQAMLEEAVFSLEQEISRQAAAQGLQCRTAIYCSVDRQGVMTVDSVTLYCSGDAYARMALFRKNVAAQLAIPEETITIQEEKTE